MSTAILICLIKMPLTLKELDAIPYVDEAGRPVLGQSWERAEQLDAVKYIKPHHNVLEVGGCYGVTSCVINHLLQDPTKHLVIEPRHKMIQVIQENRKTHAAYFQVFHGAISRVPLKVVDASCFPCEARDANVPTKTIEQLQEQYGIAFNALVIDCEGCVPQVLHENPALVEQLELILMEEDRPDIADYKSVYALLGAKGFEKVKHGFHSVWMRSV